MYDQIINKLASSHSATPALIAALIFMVLAFLMLIYRPRPHTHIWQCLSGLTISGTFFLTIVSVDAYQHEEISKDKYTQLRSDLQASPEYAPLIAEALRSERITNAQFEKLQAEFTNMVLSTEKKYLTDKVSSIIQTSASSK